MELFLGNYLGGFDYFLGHHTAIFAELMVVILTIEPAYDKGWMQLSLESNSMLVIQFPSNVDSSPPCMFHERWLNCKSLLSGISLRFSKSFRKGDTPSQPTYTHAHAPKKNKY